MKQYVNHDMKNCMKLWNLLSQVKQRCHWFSSLVNHNYIQEISSKFLWVKKLRAPSMQIGLGEIFGTEWGKRIFFIKAKDSQNFRLEKGEGQSNRMWEERGSRLHAS